LEKPFYLYTDASDYAIGAVLLQYDSDYNILRPVEFASTKLNQTQMNWHPLERDTFSFIYSIKKWKRLFRFTKLIAFTDNQSLQIMIETIKLNPQK